MSTPESIDNRAVEFIKSEIAATATSEKKRILQKFALAALGSIPWVGGFLSAAASLRTEKDDVKADDLRTQWLEEHAKKIQRLAETLSEIAARFESIGDQIDERIESEEYLDIVRKAFRVWDESDTEEKRRYVSNLISNASGTSLCSDDVIRLFIDWLNSYHESHFAIIREIYKNPGCTRRDMWANVHGRFPREDSAEADLFKLLIRDLSTGGVVRQSRNTTPDGRFLKQQNRGRKGPTSKVMESAFEASKPYELTELGKQFVHYSMNEVVPRVSESAESKASNS